MNGPQLTPEQAHAVEHRDGPLLLVANAGSGKTTVLVERFVRFVREDGLRPAQILAITFTDKAAGERRARVRARFLELGEREAAREMEGAWLTTFHGFCARVLRANAVAAGVDPGFAVLDEGEARAARGEAFDAALAAFMGEPEHPRADALELVAAYTPDRLRRMVQSVHDELRSRGRTLPRLPAVPLVADLHGAHDELSAAHAAVTAELGAAADGKTIDRARAALARCGELLARVAAGAPPGLPERKALTLTKGANALKTPACDRYRDAVDAYVQALADTAAADLVPLIDELLVRYGEEYAAAKRRRAGLDFDDLELLTRDLFDGAPAVAAAYRARYARVLVDEFQDTNRLQLDLLAHVEGDAAFWVGDRLQSIYGFRHADVRLFEERRRALAPQGATAALATSFRSRPEILAALNAAFHDAHGAGGWVPLLPARDPDPGGGPLVEVLLTDAAAWERGEDGERDALLARGLPEAAPERQAEARLVAQRVAELVAGGVKQSDVVVLLRATTDIALYERALELAGLDTLAAGGRGWWARQQVQDLCSWLAALANPRDEPALLGVLASPLVGVSSDALALLALAARRARRPVWETLAAAFCGPGEDPAGLLARLGAADRERVEAFCTRFAAEREIAPRLGLDELIARAVRATGYDLHVAALPGGRRRLANVHKLMRLAAGFEARRGRDVRAFVDLATAELEADAREADAPVDLGGQEAVRLMSIHAAKGLEFGVVVLADLGRRGNETHADLIVDGERIGLRVLGIDGCSEPALEFADLRREQRERECEEERRVMHVALTRAENRLILAGAVRLGDDWPGGDPRTAPPMSWVGPALVPAITDLAGEEPDLVHELERGGWPYAVRTVLSTPATGVLRLDAPAPGEAEQLALEVGRAQARQLAAAPPQPPAPPVPGALSYSALSSHAQCGYRFYLERILGMPRQDPPAHLLAAAPPAQGIDLLLRGTLVHELLEHTDLRGAELPGAEAVREAGLRHDAELSEAEVEDLLGLLEGFARSPLHARLAAAESLWREHVFAFLLDAGDESGPLFNGVVDVLAQERDGTALVVDYKSDHVDGADLEELVERAYGTQRRVYALAALRSGAAVVEVAHLFLTRPEEPVVARYEAADASALERDLHARAAGVLAGEYPVSETPHRGLCATCPGRNGLCRWGPDMTDRTLDDAA